MSAFRYRCALLSGRWTKAARSESVALPPRRPSALSTDAPTSTTRTDWRRPSLAGVLTGDNGPSALAETDRRKSRPVSSCLEDDLIAVEQKGAALAVGELQGLSTALAEFQQAAVSVLCGYGS